MTAPTPSAAPPPCGAGPVPTPPLVGDGAEYPAFGPFTVRQGEVFLDGTYHSRDLYERLLVVFQRSVDAGGWWGAIAAGLIRDLNAALELTE